MSPALPQRKEITGFRLILGYLGMFLILIGIIALIPMIVVAFYPAEWEALGIFGSVAAFDIVAGVLLYFLLIFKKPRSRFRRHEESMLLILTWIAAILSGAAPFFIATMLGHMDMSFSGAFFEATSGYSTTGLTVFSDFIDIEGAFCPHVYTFHRAFMNFIGGVGLVLLVASVLGAGGGGVALYVSEGHSDRLLPNIAKSAKLIFGIYSGYMVIGVVVLYLAGMPVFDAICHSMSAISGGGFSPMSDNVAGYAPFNGTVIPNTSALLPVNFLAIEIIIEVLVVFSAISFMLHTFLLRFRFKDFFRDDEIRFFIFAELAFLVTAFLGALIATMSFREGGFFTDGDQLFRASLFYTIGSMTNSGFASTTAMSAYHIIPGGSAVFLGHTMVVVLIIAMLIGGGAGSSAGGIKQYRVAIGLRSIYYSLRYRFASIHEHYPRLTNRYGETKELEDNTIHEAHHYTMLFILLFILLTTIVTIANPADYTLESAAFDVASAMSNTGLSWVIGPGFVSTRSAASFITMWAMSLGMLLGRLEILPAAYAVANVRAEIRYRHSLRFRKKREAQALELMEEGE